MHIKTKTGHYCTLMFDCFLYLARSLTLYIQVAYRKSLMLLKQIPRAGHEHKHFLQRRTADDVRTICSGCENEPQTARVDRGAGSGGDMGKTYSYMTGTGSVSEAPEGATHAVVVIATTTTQENLLSLFTRESASRKRTCIA